jgi:hypothetical protein
MAEGSLVFFSGLAAWGSLRLARVGDAWPALHWRALGGGALAGALAGIAMVSKQTELIMFPVTLLAIAASLLQRPWPLIRRAQALAVVWLAIGLGGGLTFLALNPILLQQPLRVAQMMVEMRAQLAQQQMAVNGAAHPEMLTLTAPARLWAAFSQVYLRPPAFWDVPVYLDHLTPPAEAYLAMPLNRLWPQPAMGILLAGLSAVGIGVSAYRLIRDRVRAATRAEQTLWLWATLTLALILFSIPLNWQRYFLPLIPPAYLFAAYGLVALVRPILRRMAPALAG